MSMRFCSRSLELRALVCRAILQLEWPVLMSTTHWRHTGAAAIRCAMLRMLECSELEYRSDGTTCARVRPHEDQHV